MIHHSLLRVLFNKYFTYTKTQTNKLDIIHLIELTCKVNWISSSIKKAVKRLNYNIFCTKALQLPPKQHTTSISKYKIIHKQSLEENGLHRTQLSE